LSGQSRIFPALSFFIFAGTLVQTVYQPDCFIDPGSSKRKICEC
jgi:hypothetical protein